MKTHSLKRQLLKHLWVPVLVLLVLEGIGSTIVANHISSLVHDQWLLDSAMTLQEQIRTTDGRPALDLPPAAVEMFIWDRVDRIYGQVITHDKQVLFSNAAIPQDALPVSFDVPIFYDAKVNDHHVRVVSTQYVLPGLAHQPVTIQVAETLKKREVTTRFIMVVMTLLECLTLLLTTVLIWMAVTRNIGKIDDITHQLANVNPDNIGLLKQIDSVPQEIEPMIQAINQLVLRVQDAQAFHKRFIANAAHQLRTPLATLLLQIEYALREQDQDKRLRSLLDAHRSVSRLQRVTWQLLTMMQSEQKTASMLQFKPVDLASIARHEVERFTDAAIERGMDLGYEGPEHALMILGEGHLLGELISNLLDNAIRYGTNNGTITLSLTENPVSLTVEDDGPGIPEDERVLVLERFYRGHQNDSEGCGLGLSIASEIASRHQAKLTIQSGKNGRGTRINIFFIGNMKNHIHKMQLSKSPIKFTSP